MELKTKDMKVEDGEINSIILDENDIVEIPKMMAHTLIALEETTFLIFTDKQRVDGGYEEDTHRVKLE